MSVSDYNLLGYSRNSLADAAGYSVDAIGQSVLSRVNPCLLFTSAHSHGIPTMIDYTRKTYATLENRQAENQSPCQC